MINKTQKYKISGVKELLGGGKMGIIGYWVNGLLG